mgnify:FL=1
MSIWTMDCSIDQRPSLDSNISTDIAVVGGGMAGILTARLLKDKGMDVVVLEADRIAGGNTAGTTAKITLQHGLTYADMIETMGQKAAKKYVDANIAAMSKFKELAENVDCNYSTCPAYIYTRRDTGVLERELRAAESLGIKAEITTDTELPFPVNGALKYDNQARFHPLKFIREVSRNLKIYEGTQVSGIKDGELDTTGGKVRANKVVIATHYPFINFPGYYFLRMHQSRTYLLALENAATIEGMYLDADEGGYTFRGYGNILLFGGEGHRTGRNGNSGRYDRLLKAAMQFYPQSKEIARWSAQDCVTQDKVPFIGEYSIFTPNMYVATGFRKWGMTGSMVSAIIISSLIAGETPHYADLFNPLRFNPKASGKGLSKDVSQIAKGFALRIAPSEEDSPEAIPKGCASIVTIDGRKRGIYKDENGAVFAVSVRCPHLGCQLSWNPDEKSWDCPCHGSRFTYDGKRIDGPAETNDISRQVNINNFA